MASKESNLIWIDLEMTGLKPLEDKIIEIATVVTDSNLNIVATGPELVISQPDDILDNMDDWNTEQHKRSGLSEKVRQSTLSEEVVEQTTLKFLQQHVAEGASPMCGNSICQDRRFLAHHMPKLEAFFHYRHLDVSTLKIVASLWNPPLVSALTKMSHHRALDDIMDSIKELKFYKKNFLKT